MLADKNEIKSVISMRDVLELYGADTRRKRIPCPIHNGKDANFSFKENTFTCHSQCGGGDIFRFVQLMNNCDFQTALNIICSSFNIPNGREVSAEQKKAIQERQKQAQERELAREYKIYATNRLIAYKRYLKDMEQSERVVNHIEWCYRQLDLILEGREPIKYIDDRLNGMFQQTKPALRK